MRSRADMQPPKEHSSATRTGAAEQSALAGPASRAIERLSDAVAEEEGGQVEESRGTRKLSELMDDPEQMRSKAAEYFRAADTDRSGSITRDEALKQLELICEHGGFKMPPEGKVRELIAKCDTSKDGEMQPAEFTQFFKVVVGSALKKRLTEDASFDDGRASSASLEDEPALVAAAAARRGIAVGLRGEIGRAHV